jgi:phosphatidylglycerophosphate synthase
MVSQVVAIFLLLFSLRYPLLRLPALAALWVVVVLAVVSALDYFRLYFLETGWPARTEPPPRGGGPAR